VTGFLLAWIARTRVVAHARDSDDSVTVRGL
jgi:hypothetical protein